VAVVTGGAAGMGAATCRRLVAEGASVAIADINEPGARALARELGDKAIAIAFDAEDTSSIEGMITQAVERFGRLDVLHNNAALVAPDILAADLPVVDIGFDLWDRVMAGNLRAYMAGCKFAIPHMIKNGGGAIVNTASGAAFRGGLARTAYGVSKAGIVALTYYVATQYGKDGIRCNTVSPGSVPGPRRLATPSPLRDALRPHLLTGRFGEPEDIANLVCFLASDEAGFITGQVYACDGGMTTQQPFCPELRSRSPT
jgi:NAD(P)-dependent dehydrogenase (short-subunit alcohol dehydrogenase family)